MKVQSVKLKTSVLFHAPWNPRGEITPESVADLTASIKAQGLLQDIGVWRDETNALFVIYGNRRFVACREAGMTEIPAKLYDCPLAVAQELTRIENEVRLGVDPLEDAKLLNSMRSLGFTQEELAAHFAVPLATVCRRLKLTDLAPELFVNYSGEIEVKYGPSEKELKAKLKAERDRYKKERAQEEHERKEKSKRLDAINKKFQKWAKDNIDAALKAYLKDDPLKIVDLIYTFELDTYNERKALLEWRGCRSTDRFCDLFLGWFLDNWKNERSGFDDLAKLMGFLIDVDWEAIFGSADYEYILLEGGES